MRDGALLVRIASPPVDGAANQALVSLIARVLDLPRGAVSVAGGERSRAKRLCLAGLTADQAVDRLAAALIHLW